MDRRPLIGSQAERKLFPNNRLSQIDKLAKRQRKNEKTLLTNSAARVAYQPRGYRYYEGWTEPNVAGTQSATPLARYGLATTYSTILVPKGGSIVSVETGLNADLTAGTLTIEIYVTPYGGSITASKMKVELTVDDPAYAINEVPVGEFRFEEGAVLEPRLTTSGFTPTSADLILIGFAIILDT